MIELLRGAKMFTYVLTNPSYPPTWYKIGVSKNVQKRIKQLNTAVPTSFKPVMVFQHPENIKLEKIFHNEFYKQRIYEGREFFLLGEEQLERMMEVAKKQGKTVYPVIINGEKVNYLSVPKELRHFGFTDDSYQEFYEMTMKVLSSLEEDAIRYEFEIERVVEEGELENDEYWYLDEIDSDQNFFIRLCEMSDWGDLDMDDVYECQYWMYNNDDDFHHRIETLIERIINIVNMKGEVKTQ